MIFKNISVICEGTTEVDFIKYLNKNYFNQRFISLKPIQLNGNVSIDRVADFAAKTPELITTTFIDYYGFKKQNNLSINQLESLLYKKVNDEHFIPYLQSHETEALWFCDIEVIKKVKNATSQQAQQLDAIIQSNPNPETINNSRETAPSKRLESIFKDYAKVIDGKAISTAIDVEKMKEKCPRFKTWIETIEAQAHKLS